MVMISVLHKECYAIVIVDCAESGVKFRYNAYIFRDGDPVALTSRYVNTVHDAEVWADDFMDCSDMASYNIAGGGIHG